MKKWLIPLGIGLGVAALLQQLLLNRPPRLVDLEPIPPGRSTAALRLRFSRPMDGGSLRKNLQLKPSSPYQLLGKGSSWTLLLYPKSAITGSFQLQIKGQDSRGVKLKSSSWQWDPRPTLVAARSVKGGDQIQRFHNNKWEPIAPLRGTIQALLPLGNGAGVASVTSSKPMASQVWVLLLAGDGKPFLEKQLNKKPLIFAALSSDDKGDLLVQSSTSLEPGSKVELSRLKNWQFQEPQQLAIEASGPIQLVPQGNQLVVPELAGLSLQTLPPLAPKQEMLPGSRDLSSFCPQTGRALLVRHWPDYRRSLELLEPGLPPKQLWLGTKALLATACAGGGERVWLLLLSGIRKPQLELIELNKQGKKVWRLPLTDKELDPGSKLHYDATRQVLLLLLRQKSNNYQQPAPANAHLINTNNYSIKVIPGSAIHVAWLPSRQLKKI